MTLTAPHGVDLTDWFARHVPDGSTVEVEPALPGETHEAGVHIVGKKGLRVRFLQDGDRPHIVQRTDGSSAPIPAISGIAPNWPRKRVALGISGDHDDVRLYGPRIQGGNPYAGTSNAAYDVAWDAQHGIEVIGGRGCIVKDYTARDIFADFFYVGGNARDVILCGYDFDRNGRQGISATWVDGLLICGGRMDNVRRTFLDLEPNGVGQYVRNVEWATSTLGVSRLNFLSAVGRGDVSNVNVHDITMADTMALVCTAPLGQRRKSWTLSRVTATKPQGNTQGAAMLFTRVDGVTVADCNIALQPNRGMVVVKAVDCTGVAVS